jgi:signal peptidase I
MADATTNPLKAYWMQFDSMEPTITTGSDVIADHSHYSANRPQRWDVVLFSLPKELTKPGAGPNRYMKRIIGLPGETIQFLHDGLEINGAKASVPPALRDRFSTFKNFPEYKFGMKPFQIPADSVFVVGDNPRIYVADSREFGPIPIKNIEAHVKASVRTTPVT